MQHVVLLLLLVLVSHLFLIIESSGVAVGWCRLVAAEGWAPHVLLMGHRGSPHHSSHSGRCSVLWGCHNVCTDPLPLPASCGGVCLSPALSGSTVAHPQNPSWGSAGSGLQSCLHLFQTSLTVSLASRFPLGEM